MQIPSCINASELSELCVYAKVAELADDLGSNAAAFQITEVIEFANA